MGIENDFTPAIQAKLVSGQIGLWDTRDEDKNKKVLQKKQKEAEDALSHLI